MKPRPMAHGAFNEEFAIRKKTVALTTTETRTFAVQRLFHLLAPAFE